MWREMDKSSCIHLLRVMFCEDVLFSRGISLGLGRGVLLGSAALSSTDSGERKTALNRLLGVFRIRIRQLNFNIGTALKKLFNPAKTP